MNPGEARPAQHEKAPRQDEHDEEEMDDDYGVGEESVKKFQMASRTRSSGRGGR